MLSARLQAPADQPAGQRRGWRPPLAVLAVAGALVVLALASLNGVSGSWSDGELARAKYELDGPPWTHTVLVVAGLALVAAAILVWIARRPATLLLGIAVLVAAAAVAAVADVERRSAGHVNPAQVRALPLGATRDDVMAALGAPAGTGEGKLRGGVEVECLMYVQAEPDRRGWERQFALCFADGRLVHRKRL